jgi:Ca-activated chloride channel homolog
MQLVNQHSLGGEPALCSSGRFLRIECAANIEPKRQAKHQRKALLIISDGGDNHSRCTEKEIVSVVKEADVMIYGIGIYNHYFPTQEELLGPQLLRSI